MPLRSPLANASAFVATAFHLVESTDGSALRGVAGIGVGQSNPLVRDDVTRRIAAKTQHSAVGAYASFSGPTDLKFNLQINTYPHGQCRQHRATVKANRYGIVHVGWHEFELHDEDERLHEEIERLSPWLKRRNFKDPKWRRRLAQEHPELTLTKMGRNKRH